MKKCKYCGVFIDESLNKCPLCQRTLEGLNESCQGGWYPEYKMEETLPPGSLSKKVLWFISITVISICLLINLFTGIKEPWFLFVACPILYLMLLINNTILSKMHKGAKLLIQLAGISGLLFILDVLSGYHRWSVNVVIPFLFIAGNLIITVIILKKKMLWSEYGGYVITMIFLGFLPILMYLTGVADELWADAVCALYSLLTIIGMLLFANRKFRNELESRFHF